MPALRTRNTASRTLEVITTTDEPLTPTLAIHSPTPRAFTFPKHDPPYASPSSSPFEPDPKSMAATPPPQRALSPTSSIGSETSSLFSTPSAASSAPAHRRRRSTVSDTERRPKRGDEDYIKRPENAFILFRRKCCEDRQAALEDAADEHAPPAKKQRQADLSKAISHQWKSLAAEERQYWEDLAKAKKKEHEQLYPDYVYRPQRVKKAKKGKQRNADDDDGGISFVVPVPSPPRSVSRDARRACSAPTPPPAFQTIQLPTVFMPSCPPSPTGVPRISRRASYVPPPSAADPSTSFEYLPQNAVLPPAFGAALTYDAFQTFSFDHQTAFPGRTNGVPLHALTIPREPPYAASALSPSDSVASHIFSPTSPLSAASSHPGPFTPAEPLSLHALSLRAPDCPQDVSSSSSSDPQQGFGDGFGDDAQHYGDAQLGYGGYSWGADALWPDASEGLLDADFDLAAIPPLELGSTLPDSTDEGSYFVPADAEGEFAGWYGSGGGGGW